MYTEDYVLKYCMHNPEDVLRNVFFPMFKDSLDKVVGVPKTCGYGTAVQCLQGVTFDEWKANNYAAFREHYYPTIQEQLDMIYHDLENGTKLWRASITAIKEQYPK